MIANAAASVAVLAVLATGPAWAATDPGGDPAPPEPVVALAADGTLRLRVVEPAPRTDLVRAIGARLGARAAIYGDVGRVGPVDIEGLPPAEALVRLTEPHSLALRHAKGRIVQIVLMASKGGARPTSRSIVVRRAAATPPTTRLDPVVARAASVRDIVKLSYQKDAAAAAELERLFVSSDDTAVRAAAIAALATSDRPQAKRLIDRALADREPEVRLRAAMSYLIAYGADAPARLRALARTDPAPRVREGVARLLAEEDAPPSTAQEGFPRAARR